MNDAALGARLFIALQYLLPQHALTRAVHALAHSRQPWLKNALIRAFVRGYRPDLRDAEQPTALAYESFNAFFTRALRAQARSQPHSTTAVASPADGSISQIGALHGELLLQAKGLHYPLAALLAGEAHWAERFRGGTFATIYLAPYNYHRVHMPCAGELLAAWHVPGSLFSVNATTAASVAALFARNERIVCIFQGAFGPFAVILVGALFVGSMSTVWHGEVALRHGQTLPLPAPQSRKLERGAELGRFNMGSTVILLFPPGAASWLPSMQAGSIVRMGDALGDLPSASIGQTLGAAPPPHGGA